MRNILRRDSLDNRGQPDHQPFSVVIELDALMDSMTMLRGMVGKGSVFPKFTSDELTRFPSYDIRSPEWTFPDPHSFDDLLEHAITTLSFFHRVKPYDFARRDIEFLRRKGTDVHVFIPEHWKPFADDITRWVHKSFPSRAHETEVHVHTDISQMPPSHVWVARSPDTAKTLEKQKQPFILLDGKENRNVRQGVRLIRWDQVGYALRHAEHIFVDKVHTKHAGPNLPSHVDHVDPTQDIWSGRRFVSPDHTSAALWVGGEKESLLRVITDPDARLRWPASRKGKDKPFTSEQKKRALDAVRADLKELERKIKIIERISAEALHASLAKPRWPREILERENDMRGALEDLERELRIDSVTGQKKRRRSQPANSANRTHVTDRIEVGSDRGQIQLSLQGSDYIHLIGQNWRLLQNEKLPHTGSHRAGVLAEVFTVLLLQQEGWKVYVPRELSTPQGKVKSLQDYTRINVQWFHGDDPTKPRSAEIDCLAKGPDGELYVIEVKVSAKNHLSALQNELRNHLASGGAIVNPDVRGIDERIPLLYPRHRVLVFDRDNLLKAEKVASPQPDQGR